VHARLTKRDIQILLGIFSSGGYMSTRQIWQEFFPETKNPHATQMRLKKLVIDDYLRVVEQAVKRGEGRLPYILALGPLGRDVLAFEQGIDPKLINIRPRADEERSLFLKHLLRVTDLRILLKQACAHTGLTLEWISEREIKILRTESEITIPDGEKLKIPIPDAQFTLINNETRALFQLEVDMASEDISFSSFQRQSISGKLAEYLTWEESDHFRQLFGSRPLRTLWITVGQTRKANMVQAAERVIHHRLSTRTDLSDESRQKMGGILSRRFRVATFDELHPESILTQPVWTMAGHSDLQILLD
jgi:hypothetical protein